MTPDKKFMEEQYRQAYENMRASNTKRDTLFGFYFALTIGLMGYYIGKKPDLSDTFLFNFILFSFIYSTVLGIVLGILLTAYRGYHGFFNIQSIVLQGMIHKKNYDTKDLIKKAEWNFNNCISIEFFTFILLHFAVITNFAFIILIIVNHKQNFWSMTNLFVFYLAVFIILEFIAHFIVMNILDRQKKSGDLEPGAMRILQNTGF